MTLPKIHIKINNHTSTSLQLTISNAPLPFLNALRRTILEEIPAVAISKIIFHKYVGIVPEEVLAHRLGLVPIFCDALLLVDSAVPTRNSCVRMRIRKRGADGGVWVRSDDIEVVHFDSGRRMCSWSRAVEEDDGLEEVDGDGIANALDHTYNANLPMIKPGVLITKLGPNQCLDAEMYATRGTAKEHAKYSSVNICYYRMHPILTLNRSFKNEDAHLLKKRFKDGVIGIRRKGKDEEAYVMDDKEVIDVEDIEGVSVRMDEHCVLFYVETEFIDPWEVVKRGLYVLVERSKALRRDVGTYLNGGQSTVSE
ncbi:DNA-directed RNA polymerase [Trachipleistophora hominis]|uniref:DNA-directed RNA polymerase n=1 Tax=Trachipleistophora hominis TaxID=72359 RepID=L7JZJ4_TRAHO|nr:DNA-directed RNA polymerase [Trachipleistophora hominis]